MNGVSLDDKIIPIAACNPYKSKGVYDTKTEGICAGDLESKLIKIIQNTILIILF